MKETAKGHHSLADWDYRPGCQFGLYDDEFVSAPSCLRSIANPEHIKVERFYLKAALAPCITDGRIISWQRWAQTDVASSAGYYFRCQDTPFDNTPLNCYVVTFQYGTCELWQYINGDGTWLMTYSFDPELEQNTWYHFRLSFWQYTGGDLANVLAISYEQEIGEEWVRLWYYEDPDNLFAESSVNRIGFLGLSSLENRFQWFDNTEIWKRS